MPTFLQLSRLIAGFTDISEHLARDYALILSSTDEWRAELAALEKAAHEAMSGDDPEAAVMAAMAANPAIGNAARRLAHLWYAGRLPAQNAVDAAFVSEQAYFEALIWRAARAHPPGLSGGYSGHWRYAPDG